MEIHAPQLIFIILASVSVTVHLAKHGQPQSPPSFPMTLMNVGLTTALPWWGRFFGG